MEQRTPIVIDCDPGVDDSFAIALANACPGAEIRAITAVEGNVPAELTRKNALFLAEHFHIGCRVGFGAEKPLVKPYSSEVDASYVHGPAGLGDVILPETAGKADEKPAWDLIYEEAVRAGGRLILFATGPLTNIATALRLHPDLPRYLDKFCIMGGGTFGNVRVNGALAEFNIWVDPTAAREVFAKMEVYMVGLDATHAAALRPEELEELAGICAQSPSNWFLEHLSRYAKWNSEQNGWDNHVIHDALAVASLLYPGIVSFRDCRVDVEDGPEARNNGQTFIDFDAEQANCHFAVDPDRERFVQLLRETCRYYSLSGM